MVGVVNGAGLGLNYTSYTGTVNQSGVWNQGGLGLRNTQIFINGYTGNLIVQDQDGLLAAPGTDLRALRTYNSRGSFNDDNGDNWITGVVRQSMRLTAGTWGAAGSTVVVTEEDGSERLYTWVTNRYVSTTSSGPDTYLTLSGDGTQAVFSNGPQSGTFEVATGRLLNWNSPTLLNAVFSYNANGSLAGMSADAAGTGGRIVYEYNGDRLQRVSVVDEQNRAVSTTLYAYDANGRLSRVTVDLSPSDGTIADGKVYTTDYTYVSSTDITNGMLRSIVNSDGTSQTFKWVVSEGLARISQSWGGDDQIWSYDYSTSARTLRVTQPGGFTTDFWYDGTGRLKQSHPSKGANNGVTNDTIRTFLEYYTTDNQATFTDYDRSVTVYNYDADNNLILVRDAAGNTVRRNFVNRLVTTETFYAVADPDGYGTGQPAAPATTRYVYDAEGKLRFKLSPEGAVTELRYTGKLPTSTITYLGGAYNVSALTITQTPTEAQMTTWVNGADKSRTSRVDTVYDLRGQKLRETAYAATDSSGNGLTSGQHVVVYAYDAAGRLLTMTDGSDASITYAYDGLGRVLTRQQGSITTSYVHQDGGNGYVSTVTEQNGLVTVSTYDKMGRLLGMTRTQNGNALGTSTNYYNARGLLYKTQDPTGVFHWYLYDERANKVAEVDGNGTVTEFRYDVSQRPIQTIVYATPLAALSGTSPNLAWADPPAAPTLASIRPAETAKDQRSWTLYDAAGRPTRRVDAAGFVTETQYDGVGRVTGTVRYANAIDLASFAANPTAVNATPAANADSDRVSRKFYSTEGRLLADLDAEGFLVEYRYDAAGRLSATVRYADQTPATLRAAGTLAQLRPTTASPKDQTTRYVYDGQSRVIGEIDAEGHVTEQLYDDRGHLVQRTRYAAKLAAAQITAFDAGTGGWRPAGTPGVGGDRTEFWHYNTLGQLDEQTDADGTVTRRSYDNAGRVISTTRAAGSAEARTQKVRYDAVGRVVGELSARGAALLVDGQTQAQVDAIWAQYGTVYTYDAAGRRTSQIVSDGTSTLRTIFFYNEDDQVTHTINALGEVTENQYDGLGQLVKTVAYGGRLGATTLNGLSGGLANEAIRNAVQELLAQRTPGNQAYASAQSVFDYDARGLLKSTTNALGYSTSTTYNAFGQADVVSRQIRLGGALVQGKFEFDRRGVLVATTADFGGLNAITRTRVDAFGRVYEQLDARGVLTKTGYDRLGRVVQTTDGVLVNRYTSYDAFSRVVDTTDGNGQKTTYRYDVAARTVEVTTPEGIRSRVVRNRHGEVESRTDGNNVTTSYAYTENGELRLTTTPLNGVNVGTGTKYDSLGRVAETTDANGIVTRLEYDALNRVTSRIVDPDGANGLKLTTSYVYEDTAAGTSVLTTAADGRQTRQSFDVAGRLVASTVDPSGLALTTTYELDADGRTLKVTDPNNIVTRYEYDKLGRRIAEVTDDGINGGNAGDLKLTRTYAYDIAGRLTSSTDWNNARTVYAYDDANRLVYQIDPMGSVRYTEYDGEGRERRVTRLATPLTAAQRDTLGTQPTRAQVAAVVTSVPAKDQVTGRVFDKDGRVQFSVDAAGTVTEFRYDGAGRVKQQIVYGTAVTTATWMDGTPQAPTGSADDRVTSTLYDDLGRATTVVDAEGGITAMTYDNAGNLRQKTAYARVASAATMQALRTAGAGWTAATLGAPLTHVQDRVTNYRYDTAGRLRFEYDAEGYVTETRYDGLKTTTIRHAEKVALDVIPALGADDRSTFVELDKAGRVLRTVDAMNVETRSFYDNGGRLTAQTQAYGLAEATTTAYVYDDAGHVTLKTVAQGTDAASSTRYGYDALGRMTTEIEARGVALAESNTLWARNERKAQSKAEFAEQLSAADKQAFLNRYTTTHEYDAAGRRTATINAMNARTSTEYDAFGNGVKVTDPLGNVGYFYFDKLNRVTMQVDPEGYATRTIYAAAGSNQVAKVRRYFTKALNLTTALMPDPVTTAKDSLTTNVYDRLDRLVSTTAATESGNVAESTQYSAGGNRFDKQVTNKVGGTAVFNTDKLGNTVKETLPVTVGGAAVVNSYGYDAFGNRTSSVEAVNPDNRGGWISRATSYKYDKAGRLTHRIGTGYTAFDGATQSNSTVIPVEWTRYDALGRVVEQVSRGNWVNDAQVVGGARSLNRYDAAGNKLEQIAADGAYVAYEYDAAGHAVRESARGAAATVNGSTWTPPAVNNAVDRNTVMVYDALGRLVEKSRENVSYWEADASSNQILAPLTGPTKVRLQGLVYDAAGNVVQEIDGRGNSVYSYYDKVGRKVLRIDQESYAVGWDYEGFQDAATTEVKYAGRVAAYASQTDTQQAVALRDPATLRAGLSLTDARTTRFVLDTLGRVTEKRVLGVATTYLNASGVAVNTTMDAVSTFEYDGLGNVKKQRDLVGLSPDGGSQVWNETTVQYDALGRETRRIAPGFTDFQSRWVTPITDTEYNGLGLVSRTTLRGLTTSEDRISRFDYNGNGDRVGMTDAKDTFTRIELDAKGQVGRTTVVGAQLAFDGSRVDLVKRYAYDAIGRVSAEYDGDARLAQTGEIRRTRYNVFGDVTGKGVGEGWQEFAEYNVLGQVERNNSEGGVIAVFLYDRNGNATRKIISGVADLDLRNRTVAQAAGDLNNLTHTFSVHDRRNQLVKTVELAATFQTDVAARAGAVSQALTALYGALQLTPTGGGAYEGANGGTTGGLGQTVVSSPDAVGALNGSSASGASSSSINVGDSKGAVGITLGGQGYSTAFNWSGTLRTGQQPNPTQAIPFTLPSSPIALGLPAGARYEVRDDADDRLIGTMIPGETLNLGAYGPRGTGIVNRYNLIAIIDGRQVQMATMVLVSGRGGPPPGPPGGPPQQYVIETTYRIEFPNRVIVQNQGAARVEVVRKTANGGDEAQPLYGIQSYARSGLTTVLPSVPDTSQFLTNGWAAGEHVIEIRRYDAENQLINATRQTLWMTSGAGVTQTSLGGMAVPDLEGRLIPGSNQSGLSLLRVAGENMPTGTIYIRAAGSNANYDGYGFSGGYLDVASLGLNGGGAGYEFYIVSSRGTFTGTYTGGGGAKPVVNSLRWASTSDTSFRFNANIQSDPNAPAPQSYDAVFEFWKNGQWQRVNAPFDGSGFTMSGALIGDLAGTGYSPFVQSQASFRYQIFAVTGGLRRLVANSAGNVAYGRASSISVTSGTVYPGIARLGVRNFSGPITLSIPGRGEVAFAASDARRWGGDSTFLHLADYINPAGPTQISFRYSGGDAAYNGTLTLYADGRVAVDPITPSYYGSSTMRIDVPGMTAMKTLRIQERGGAVMSNDEVTYANGYFQFPIRPGQLGRNYDVYFEALGGSPQGVIYIGKGAYEVSASGTATYRATEIVYRQSVLNLTATSASDRMAVRLRQPGGGFTEWLPVTGGVDRTFILDAYKPASGGPATYEFEYKVEDEFGTVMLKKGHGSFTLAVDGKVAMGAVISDRTPLAPITFYGPNDPAAAKLRLTIDGRTIELAGTWNGRQMQYVWARPFDGAVIETERRYPYTMEILTASGQPAEDAVGETIPAVQGVMTVAANGGDQPFRFEQLVQQVNQSAQVRRFQTYNAFGEIAEEYDDSTLARARAMAQQYADFKLGQFTIDESAVRTRFRYNTQGQLIEKLEAETFETLANGFVRRTRPTTSYGHDLLGRTVSIADANGNVNRQSYIGGSDRVATRFNADGASRTTGYDVFADARKLIDEMQGVVLQDFDALGRLVTVTRQGITRKQNFATGEFAGAVAVTNTLYERYEYDGLGQRTRRTDAAGAIEKTFYDARGRVVSTVSGSGATIQYQYTAVARGAADPVLGLGALDVGGYRRTTVNADARTLVDEIDYFGRTTWHQDLGGQRSDYVYGLSGRLMSQTSTGGQDIRYDYTMSGQLRQVRDVAASQRTVTQYAYDDAGNRTYEMYGKLNAQNDSVASILQSGNIQYDELNRIARSWDGSKSYDLRYEYDAVGNRRSAISTYWDVTGRVSERTDFWYTYDAMNRFTTTMGWLTGRGTSAGDTSTSIQIGNEGTSVRYNGLGQRIGVTYKDEADPNITHNERYEYSVDGYLEDAYLDNALVSRRRVDATGRTLQYKQWKGGVLQETKTTEFDADNRVRSEKVTDSQSGNGTTTYAYFQSASDNAAAATVDGRGALARTTFTPAAGGGSTVSTYVYQYWDTAKQSTITTTQPSGDPGKSTFTYDKNGHLASVVDTVARRELYYTTSAQGQVLQRDEIRRDLSGAPRFIHRYYYADGRRVGDVGNDGLSDRVSYAEQIARDAETPEQRRARSKNPTPVNSADFDQNYEPINAGYPVSASSRYTVRGGDTLSSIAQSVWGDAAMWYLLADANGLSGGEKLVEGQVLVIPNKVTNIHNNATTFRPYNPGEAMGNVNPTLPDPPPPPKKGGCGGIGMILMVVVAVVVTIYTAGAAAGVLGATVSGAGATAFSTGLAVMAGGTAAGVTVAGTAAMIAGAAIGAAVGSIASQVVGMATGNVDKFSWKAVGQSALAAGVTAGVGSYLGAAPGSTAASSNASTLTKVSDAVMRAGLNSAVTQAIQGEWSWREVGAATISAGAGYAAGQAVSAAMSGVDANLARIAMGAGSAVAGAWASSQVMGYNSAETRARLSQAFISGLGQGIGSAIGDSIASPSVKTLQDTSTPVGRFVREDIGRLPQVNTQDLESLQLPSLEVQDNRSLLNAMERGMDPSRYTSVEGTSLVARSGDSISRMLGTSSPQAIGNFMRANNLTSDRIDAGRNYFVPSSSTAYGDSASLGQFALNQGNERIAAARAAALIGPDGMRIGPTIERAQALGISSGSTSSFALSGDYPAFTAMKLSGRERATDWFSSMVGRSRAGNVLTGAFDAWLATPEAISNLPDLVAGVPSALGRLANNTASYAGRLWDDPWGTSANTLASGVDGFRSSFNRVVNGDGRAMGSTLFAIGTAGVPLGRTGSIVDTGLGLVEIDPMLIRTTQTTVKQQGATLPNLVESMKRNGFVVEPDRLIDVVRMPDGGLTSLDNTRILAAQRAGVNVQVRLLEHTDLLPDDLDFVSRFIGRKGEVPVTFGDAVMNRISNQSALYRSQYPYGSPFIGSAH